MKNFILAFAVSLLSSTAFGGGFETTLESILDSAPSLIADRASYTAEVMALKADANLPDPEIEGQYLNGGGDNRWNATVGWSLDWPGVYRAKKKNAEGAESDAATVALSRRKALRAELGEVLVNYVAALNKERVYRALLATSDSIAELSKTSAGMGHMTKLEQYKIAIERGRVSALLIEQQGIADAARAEILAIGGQDAERYLSDFVVDFPEDAGIGREEYLKKAENASDILLAELEVSVARRRERIAASEGLPSISFGYVHAYEENTHFNGANLGFSVPLFSGRGKRNAAEAAVRAEELKADSRRLAVMRQTESQVKRLEMLRQSIAQLAPVFAGHEPRQLLMSSLSLGQISYQDYLHEQNYYMEAELDYIDLLAARASLLVALSSL